MNERTHAHERLAHIKGLKSTADLATTIKRSLTNHDSQKIDWLISFGAVYVNKVRTTDRSIIVKEADIVRIHLNPRRYELNFQDIRKNRVVLETEDFLIFDKPSGLPMHPTVDNLSENLLSSIEQRLFVTHRLDVPTSGLVLVAKNPAFQALFNKLVAERKIHKTYQALTLKPLAPGILKHFMRKSLRAPKEVVAGAPPDPGQWDECLLNILSCEPVEFNAGVARAPAYESRIQLLTGRTHQIRAQLSHAGASLVGDEMYGGMRCRLFGLHSAKLNFTCPKTSRIFDLFRARDWLL